MANGYDSLNRLVAAQATAGTAYNGLQASWSYDSFGNRTQESFSGSDTGNAPVPPSSSATYNANNQIQGVGPGEVAPTYDAAGNVLSDTQGQQYAYDAEGRVCAVSGSGGLIGYLYDAEGTRIAKGTITLVNVNGTPTLSCDTTQNNFQITTSYILGPDNEQLTELNWGSGTPQWAHTNVWAAGELIATYSPDPDQSEGQPGILNFYLTDWLGSRRVTTDYAGNVQATCDSLPYGNGESCTPTPTEHLFTGKERDAESGNDYFGARYYASSMGRWLSPDPINLTKARLMNPANTLNKYAYGANNPLKYIDKDGQDITIYFRPPSGASGDYGHVLLGALNQATGKVDFLDYYPAHGTDWKGDGPGTFNPGDMAERGAQNAEGKFASLTIQTTPEAAQKVLDLIAQLKSSPAADYHAIIDANNCTTIVQDVLSDLGLDYGDVFPSSFWNDAYTDFAPYAQQHPFETWMYGVPHQPGNEYGNPRYNNQSQLMFSLYWLQSHPDQDKSSVTATATNCVTDSNGQQYCDTQ